MTAATLDDAGAALLRGVLESPAEDAPRLVYADWLEENGDRDRAEFIRTQIELSGLGEPEELTVGGCPHEEYTVEWTRYHCRQCMNQPTGNCRWHSLNRRSWELHSAGPTGGMTFYGCRCDWLGKPLGTTRRADDQYGMPLFRPKFRRGFVAELACGGGDWVQNAKAVLAAHPVELVTLTSLPEVAFTAGRTYFHFRHLPNVLVRPGDAFRAAGPNHGAVRGTTVHLCASLWPKIKFVMPTPEQLRNRRPE